jgi:hypothetical protein
LQQATTDDDRRISLTGLNMDEAKEKLQKSSKPAGRNVSVNVDRRVIERPVRPRATGVLRHGGRRHCARHYRHRERRGDGSGRASGKHVLTSSRFYTRLIEGFNSAMTSAFSERDEIGLRPADEMIRDHIRLGAKDRCLEEARVRRPLQECYIKGR